MTAAQVLKILGTLDGDILLGAGVWAAYDPAHLKLAFLAAGIATAIGKILNLVAAELGQTDVVIIPVDPPPAAK